MVGSATHILTYSDMLQEAHGQVSEPGWAIHGHGFFYTRGHSGEYTGKYQSSVSTIYLPTAMRHTLIGPV